MSDYENVNMKPDYENVMSDYTPTMVKTWFCGDCGAEWSMSRFRCGRPFDDYLSLRGGSIELAIQQAVERTVAPLVDEALRRIEGRTGWFMWTWVNPEVSK